MTEQMAAQYRYDVTSGVFVYSVEEGSAAEKAGLQMGDVITRVDDSSVSSLEDLTAVKKQYSAGDTVTLTVYRQGETITVNLTWDATPAETGTDETQNQTTQGSDQYGNQYGGFSDPYDLFDYFFGR